MASHNRKRQQVTGGHGRHFMSPKKSRNNTSKREQIFLGNPAQCDKLRTKLANLFNPQNTPEIADPSPAASEWMDIDNTDFPLDPGDDNSTAAPPSSPLKPKRRILPNAAAYHLYHKWQVIVPALIDQYLQYTNATIGKPVGPGCPSEILRPECSCGHEKAKALTVTCLFYDRESLYTIHWLLLTLRSCRFSSCQSSQLYLPSHRSTTRQTWPFPCSPRPTLSSRCVRASGALLHAL